MYPKYLLYDKFTDNMQDADDMVYDPRVENVTNNIHDNQRLFTGNLCNLQYIVWINMALYKTVLHIIAK